VTNNDTGQKRTSRTSVDGSYTLSLLPLGSYKAQFGATGFKTADVERVRINVTEASVLDEVLEVGAQREQITVEGNVEAVQTGSSSLGNVVSEKQVSGLPLTTRNYTQIISLAAGVNAPVNNASAVGNGSLDVSVKRYGPRPQQTTRWMVFQLRRLEQAVQYKDSIPGSEYPVLMQSTSSRYKRRCYDANYVPQSRRERQCGYEVGNQRVARNRLRVLPQTLT